MPHWNSWKTWLAIVLTVACGLRVAAAVVIQSRLDQQPDRDFLIEGDANGYWILGEKLASGQPFEIYDPPRRVMRTPGFPLVLSIGMRHLGKNSLGIRLMLAMIGVGACAALFWLGKELDDPVTGVIAAGFAAVSPAFVGFSPLVLSETLFALAMTLSLVALAKMIGSANYTRQHLTAFIAGLMVGVATLVRPSWILVAPGFGLLFWLVADRTKRGLISALLLMAGLAVALLPWTIRNHQVTGHCIPTTLWVGPSLYDGLNPQANGDSDMTFIENDGVYQRMSEYDADQYYRRAAWDYAVKHPGKTAELALAKQARYWSPWPNAAQFRNWALIIPLAAFFALVMGLAAYGGWRVRDRFWLCFLAAAPLFYFAAIHSLFVGSIRYRLPAEYPLLILTAIGLRQILAIFQSKDLPTQEQRSPAVT